MTIYIGSDNIHQFAKVQSANTYVERDDVVILWDELDREGRKLAEHIDIDVKVQASDPGSVPDKWNDDIVELEGDLDFIAMIKMLAKNPSRYEVYRMLREENPSQPRVLWWLAHIYPDPDYFRLVADACHYGLFRGDPDYLWATIAFADEYGEGRFHWPESTKEDPKVKSIKKKVVEQTGIRSKEVDLAWDDLKNVVGEMADLTKPEMEFLGIEDDEQREDDSGGPSSLLDF